MAMMLLDVAMVPIKLTSVDDAEKVTHVQYMLLELRASVLTVCVRALSNWGINMVTCQHVDQTVTCRLIPPQMSQSQPSGLKQLCFDTMSCLGVSLSKRIHLPSKGG